MISMYYLMEERKKTKQNKIKNKTDISNHKRPDEELLGCEHLINLYDWLLCTKNKVLRLKIQETKI